MPAFDSRFRFIRPRASALLACVAALGAMPAHALAPLRGVAQVSVGSAHACVVTTAGGAKCWGGNGGGDLGDGTTVNRFLPVDVSGLSHGVAAIRAGSEFTCALTTGGGVKCWGLNYRGQIGDGHGAWGVAQHTPVDVSGLTQGAIAIGTGNEHACALLAGGGVKCWGRNNVGQLGDGTTTDRLTPVAVSGLGNAVAISVGGGETSGYTCARLADGSTKCWGSNAKGQLGDGTTTNRSVPVTVSGLPGAALAIAAGDDHTCALLGADDVRCWGGNGWYRLGNPDFGGDYSTTPLVVAGLSGVAAIDVRGGLACARLASARVKCWGVFYWTVGAIYPTFSITPLDQGLDDAAAISVGGGDWTLAANVCALTTAGGVKCWGGNRYGQLGNGTSGDYNATPGEVLQDDAIFANGFD